MKIKLIQGIVCLLIALILSISLAVTVGATGVPEILIIDPENEDEILQIIELEIVLPEIYDAIQLTPEGNLTLIDDISGIRSSDKQFITVVTKSGNFFYIVIDRAGDRDNVHFLNLVDEADLMAILEGERVQYIPPPVEPEPIPEPVQVKEPEPVVQEKSNNNLNGVILLIILIGIGGGVAYYFLKVRKPIANNSTPIPEIDEYNDEYFDTDEDEYNGENRNMSYNDQYSTQTDTYDLDDDDTYMENFKQAIRDINADNSNYNSNDGQRYDYSNYDTDINKPHSENNFDDDEENDYSEDNFTGDDSDMKMYSIPSKPFTNDFINKPEFERKPEPTINPIHDRSSLLKDLGEFNEKYKAYKTPEEKTEVPSIQNELQKHRENSIQTEPAKKNKNSKTIRITFDLEDDTDDN